MCTMTMTNASRKHEGSATLLLEVYILLNLSNIFQITTDLEVGSPDSERKCN